MPDETTLGTQIAGYRIERIIGRGGMSVVYLAEHLRLSRRVALKVLSPQLADDARFRERFLRESKVAASIDHPNIVPIYDADESGGTLYIAMRYVEGTDLHSVLRQGRLGPERAVKILDQVAAALDAAHAHDLVHRDVKPGNVLLTAEDHVYLADFGLTKRALSVSGLTETGQLVGTVDYVAPEQIKGDPVDPRSDVYSLGCMVYECLTGEIPYPRDMEVGVLWAHVQAPAPAVTDKVPELPAAVDAVVVHAMAKDPAERTSSAGQVALELREAFGLEDTGTVTLVRQKRRSSRRVKVTVGAIVAALVVVVVAGVILLRTRDIVPPVDSVARIEKGERAFDDWISVGRNPTGVAYGSGSVWVISQGAQTVQRIDPKTRTVEAPQSARGAPTGIAWGEDAVWITDGFDSKVVRVNPQDDSVDPLAGFNSHGAKAIVVAFGSIWLADENGDQILRVDPATEELIEAVKLPEGSLPTSLAACEGCGAAEGIWVVNELGDNVRRIDPATNELDRDAKIDGVDAPRCVSPTDDGIWVTSTTTDTVWRFDPETGATLQALSLEGGQGIPDGPTTILATASGIWLASNIDHVVVRIDPNTSRVEESLPIGGIADGMTADDVGNVWVTVHEP